MTRVMCERKTSLSLQALDSQSHSSPSVYRKTSLSLQALGSHRITPLRVCTVKHLFPFKHSACIGSPLFRVCTVKWVSMSFMNEFQFPWTIYRYQFWSRIFCRLTTPFPGLGLRAVQISAIVENRLRPSLGGGLFLLRSGQYFLNNHFISLARYFQFRSFLPDKMAYQKFSDDKPDISM